MAERLLRESVACSEVSLAAISYDTHLIRDLGIDSLGLLRLVVAIEEVCGVQIPDEDLDLSNFETAGKLAEYVERFRVRDRSC